MLRSRYFARLNEWRDVGSVITVKTHSTHVTTESLLRLEDFLQSLGIDVEEVVAMEVDSDMSLRFVSNLPSWIGSSVGRAGDF